MISEQFVEENVLNYLNDLNSINSGFKELYDKILNFENGSSIPAVRYDAAVLLNKIVSYKKPKSLLEIGFGSGMSSIFMYIGNKKINKFITIELDKIRTERGLKLLNNLEITGINLLNKNAFDYLKENNEKYDIIFLDAGKKDYILYLPILKERLNENGLLICDNILMGTMVLKNEVDKKYRNMTEKIKLFNDYLSNDKELVTLFLPVGDGISISYRNV
jgi:predicted O-methyltransferase YrrM